MGNINENVSNIRVQVSEKCTEREKSIIELYWKFNGFEFLNTAKSIMETFEISQSQLNKLISSRGLLMFSIPCGSCPKFDDFQVSSRLNFKSIINQALTSNLISTYKCSFCISKEQEEAYLKNVQEQKKINENLEKAIETENWLHLSNFQKGMLCNCLKMNFVELKKHYRPILGSDNWILFIESLETIEAYNLLSLQRDSTTKEIINYRYLDKLTSFKNEISIKETITKSSFDLGIETNELKFRLTTNKDQHYPDRPSHTGTIIFNQKIVIEPGVEYIYGLWPRANENMYLTITPLKNLDKFPEQKRITDHPVSLQKGMEEFLKKLGKNF